MDIGLLINRVEWCRKNKCLPYVMRDINCWDSEERDFYIDYAAYCNQPSFFKSMDFETFLKKRTNNQERIRESLKIYHENTVYEYAIQCVILKFNVFPRSGTHRKCVERSIKNES